MEYFGLLGIAGVCCSEDTFIAYAHHSECSVFSQNSDKENIRSLSTQHTTMRPEKSKSHGLLHSEYSLISCKGTNKNSIYDTQPQCYVKTNCCVYIVTSFTVESWSSSTLISNDTGETWKTPSLSRRTYVQLQKYKRVWPYTQGIRNDCTFSPPPPHPKNKNYSKPHYVIRVSFLQQK